MHLLKYERWLIYLIPLTVCVAVVHYIVFLSEMAEMKNDLGDLKAENIALKKRTEELDNRLEKAPLEKSKLPASDDRPLLQKKKLGPLEGTALILRDEYGNAWHTAKQTRGNYPELSLSYRSEGLGKEYHTTISPLNISIRQYQSDERKPIRNTQLSASSIAMTYGSKEKKLTIGHLVNMEEKINANRLKLEELGKSITGLIEKK